MSAKKLPSDIDRHVGALVKRYRRNAKLSQEQLGKEVGITFQQLQKYEKGHNRISVGRLYEIATALGRPLSDFFIGLENPDSGETQAFALSISDHESERIAEATNALLSALSPALPPGAITSSYVPPPVPETPAGPAFTYRWPTDVKWGKNNRDGYREIKARSPQEALSYAPDYITLDMLQVEVPSSSPDPVSPDLATEFDYVSRVAPALGGWTARTKCVEAA